MDKRFSVSAKEGEVLNWSTGLFLGFSVINIIDHWTSAPNAGQGVLVQAFASVQSYTGIQIAETLLLLATQLTMWEVFRRCLNRSNHFFLHLSVVVTMVLSALSDVASCLPMLGANADGTVAEGPFGSSSALVSIFVSSSLFVLFFVQLFTGIGLIRKFAGMIRWYGISLVVCPLLSSLLSMAYLYIYNNVGGVSMTDIMTYGIVVSLAGFALNLLPFCLLRATMSADE